MAAQLIDLIVVSVAVCLVAGAIYLVAPRNATAFADQLRYKGFVGGIAAVLAFLIFAVPLNWIYRAMMKSSRAKVTLGSRWLGLHR